MEERFKVFCLLLLSVETHQAKGMQRNASGESCTVTVFSNASAVYTFSGPPAPDCQFDYSTNDVMVVDEDGGKTDDVLHFTSRVLILNVCRHQVTLREECLQHWSKRIVCTTNCVPRPANLTPDPTATDGPALVSGGIVGIVIGISVFGLAVVVVVIVVLFVYRRRAPRNPQGSASGDVSLESGSLMTEQNANVERA